GRVYLPSDQHLTDRYHMRAGSQALEEVGGIDASIVIQRDPRAGAVHLDSDRAEDGLARGLPEGREPILSENEALPGRDRQDDRSVRPLWLDVDGARSRGRA